MHNRNDPTNKTEVQTDTKFNKNEKDLNAQQNLKET